MARRPIVSFVLLAYGFTIAWMLPLGLSNHGLIPLHVPEAWEAGAAFGPFIAAWLVLRSLGAGAVERFWQSFKNWRLGLSNWVLVVGSPLAFLAVAVAVAGGEASVSAWAQLSLIQVLDLVIVASLLQSLGEEPGWRGFLLPRLRERFGPLSATFAIYPIWLFWHLPMVLSRPEFTLGQFAGFALGILSAAVWLTLIHERTRSILAAVVWHALLNITRGAALAVSTQTFLNYGLAVTVSALAVGIWLWRRPPRHYSETIT